MKTCNKVQYNLKYSRKKYCIKWLGEQYGICLEVTVNFFGSKDHIFANIQRNIYPILSLLQKLRKKHINEMSFTVHILQ
jgi:hypothetical protein